MTEKVSGAERQFGDFAPEFVNLTDDVLFGRVWVRDALTPRDRSLITIAALIAGGHTDQLRYHLGRGVENGLEHAEIVEVITHLAFYSGWPNAMSAMAVAKDVLEVDDDASQ